MYKYSHWENRNFKQLVCDDVQRDLLLEQNFLWRKFKFSFPTEWNLVSCRWQLDKCSWKRTQEMLNKYNSSWKKRKRLSDEKILGCFKSLAVFMGLLYTVISLRILIQLNRNERHFFLEKESVIVVNFNVLSAFLITINQSFLPVPFLKIQNLPSADSVLENWRKNIC